MISRNPLIRRINRHKSLSILFRSLGNSSIGMPRTQEKEPDLLFDSAGSVKAALVDPASRLPQGIVVEPLEAFVSARPIPMAPQTRDQTGRSPLRAGLRRQTHESKRSPPAGKGHSPPLEANSAPAPHVQMTPHPPSPLSSDTEPVEPEALEASWDRLEAIYERHQQAQMDPVPPAGKIEQPANQVIGGTDPGQGDLESRPPTEQFDPDLTFTQSGSEEIEDSLILSDVEPRPPDEDIKLHPTQAAREDLVKDPFYPPAGSPPPATTSGERTVLSRKAAGNPSEPAGEPPTPSAGQPGTLGDTAQEGSSLDNTRTPTSGNAVHPQGEDPPDLSASPDEPLDLTPAPPPDTPEREELVGEKDLPNTRHRTQPVPLQAAWPVHRWAGPGSAPEGLPMQSQPVRPAGNLDASPPAGEHTEVHVLRSAPPGQPTESPIDVLPPRRPRPNPTMPPAPPNAPGSFPGSQGANIVAKKPIPNPQSRDEPVPEIVDTNIGPLPADLWGLIGKTPPPTPMGGELGDGEIDNQPPISDPAQRAVKAAEGPARDAPPRSEKAAGSSPPRLIDAPGGPSDGAEFSIQPPVQRLGETESSRAEQPDTNETGNSAGPETGPDIEALARQVYPLIRRRLGLEWERTRKGY